MYKESYFDGGLFSYIGHAILAILITVLTLGICAPWGMFIIREVSVVMKLCWWKAGSARLCLL